MLASDEADMLAQIYTRIAEALQDADADITEEILKDYIPGVVLDLAVDLDLIDHPEPGPVWIGPYFMVTEKFRDGFLEKLPIAYLAKIDWAEPTPTYIYKSFLREVRLTLNETEILKLMIGRERIAGLLQQDRKGNDEAAVIRDSSERKFLDTLIKKAPFMPNRIRDHHKKLAAIIRQRSKRWP